MPTTKGKQRTARARATRKERSAKRRDGLVAPTLQQMRAEYAEWAEDFEFLTNFNAIGFYERILSGELDVRFASQGSEGQRGGITRFDPRPFQVRHYREILRHRMQRKRMQKIVVKSRQVGFSVGHGAFLWGDAMSNEACDTVVTAHQDKTLQGLQKMYRVFAKQEKKAGKAKRMQDRLFQTPTYSEIRLLRASEELARGDSITHLHVSEADYIENLEESLFSAMPAVKKSPWSTIVLETTIRRDMGSEFRDFVDRTREGKTDFSLDFVSWVDDTEARLGFKGDRERTEFAAMLAEHEFSDYIHKLQFKLKLDLEQIHWWWKALRSDALGRLDAMREMYPADLDDAFELSQRGEFFYEAALGFYRTRCRPPSEYRKLHAGGMDVLDDPRDYMSSPSLHVWQPPEYGEEYVIGADPSASENRTREHGSESYFVVLNANTGEQVAEWCGYATTPEFAAATWRAARWYNDALVVPEANLGSGYINHLVDKLEYDHVYRREKFDATGTEETSAYGFYTSSTTRGLLMDALQDMVNNQRVMIRSRRLVDQLEGLGKRNGAPQKKQYRNEIRDDGAIALALCAFGHDGLKRKLWRKWTDESAKPEKTIIEPKEPLPPSGRGYILLDDTDDDDPSWDGWS